MSYTSPVPVSRKRKKSRKPKPTREITSSGPPADFLEYRRHLDARRESLATEAARALMPVLATLATDSRSAAELEDAICARLGAQMLALHGQRPEDYVGPNEFAQTILTAAAEAVRVALDDREHPSSWEAPWRVLTAIAGIVPFPLNEPAREAIAQLRRGPGGKVLPRPADVPSVVGPVLWTRDAYGSRFGVTAAFSAPGGPDRWYLWDIDACCHQPFTVHSGYFPGPDQALAAWRSGVEEPAAAQAAFAPVDDTWLMYELLPAEEGFMRAGGEDEHQLAEYHRSKRLAEVIREGIRPNRPTQSGKKLTSAEAAELFTAWLAEHRPGTPPTDLGEQIEELADSWQSGELAELYHTCSPHRVAATTLHVRGYYQEDFAEQLLALLPDWVSWLSAHNGTAPALSDRCLPYARGASHPAADAPDGKGWNYLARVPE